MGDFPHCEKQIIFGIVQTSKELSEIAQHQLGVYDAEAGIKGQDPRLVFVCANDT